MASVPWLLFSFCFAALLARRGWKKKSLAPSGAAAALCVGFITMACGLRFGVVLITFYLSSSLLTKYKAEVKKQVEADFKEGGQRNWVQVLANSALGSTLCCAAALNSRALAAAPGGASGGGGGGGGATVDRCLDWGRAPVHAALVAGFLGHYAACNGDTWASEIGILSSTTPQLVTTFKKVRPGTNGGVTLLGTVASVAGGALIGAVFGLLGAVAVGAGGAGGAWGGGVGGGGEGLCSVEAAWRQWRVVLLGAGAGLVGSLTDSLLGATVQYSGFCSLRKKVVSHPGPGVRHVAGINLLSNSQINFVSSAVAAALSALAASVLF